MRAPSRLLLSSASLCAPRHRQGDAEGNVESNLVVAFMRDFVRVWARNGDIKRVRVFFPVRVLAPHAGARCKQA
jgi:hypothetical protein